MGEANAVKKNNFIQMLMRPQVLVYVILIIMLIIANIVSPGYLKGKHLLSMLRIAAFLGIVCIGQNLVILIGGIDMGVPYVIMIGNVIGAEILKGQDSNIGKALVAVILAGAIIGIIESIGINYFKINAFIMTLGMGIIIEGTGVAPHIDIENDPYLEYNGEDQQLNKAIQVILEKLKTEKKEIPSIPAFPNKAAKKK